MKIKKIKFLFIVVFAMFIILPIKVNAMSLNVYEHRGTLQTIEVESSDTIEAVKEKIGMASHTLTVNNTILILNGKELQNGRTLNDYSVKSTDIIYMSANPYYTLNINGGIFEGLPSEQTEYIVPGYVKKENLKLLNPKREGYIFKGWYTKSVGGYPLEYCIENNLWEREGTKFYAHWDIEGTVSIDLTNAEDGTVLSGVDSVCFRFLVNKGIIIVEDETGEVKNKDGSLLFTVNLSNQVTFADNLTKKNNIVYTLSPTEKEELEAEDVTNVPDKIELIVSTKEVYKVVFDANGGFFKNDVKTIDIEDIINFNYETFEKPTRYGYKFIGFYTEDDKSYYDVMNSEAGIEEDTTFYAKWETLTSGGGAYPGISEGGEQEDNNNTGNTNKDDTNPENTNTDNTNTENTNNNNTNTENTSTDNINTENINVDNTNTSNTNTNKLTGENPQTSDNIMLFVIILGVSIIGVIVTTRIKI